MAGTDCPSDERLQAFLLGKTSEQEDSRLREHLGQCPGCEDRLGALQVDDLLVERVRAGSRLAEPDGVGLDEFLKRATGSSRVASTPGGTFDDPTSIGAGSGSPAAEPADAGDLLIALQQWSQGPSVPSGHDGGPIDAATDASVFGDLGRVGAFRILSVLGQGGMGVVFLAEDTSLQRLVALKAMKANNSPSAVMRFVREARAAAQFVHPNLAMIYAVEQERGVPYISMELLKGPDLENRVRHGGPLPAREAAEAVRHAARGLQHAHSKGVIHRDVKPSNLMYAEEGFVKVLDLGVARISASALDDSRSPSEATASGMVVGTLRYMAPEQALDATTVDERADVFSLGGVLHFLLTGRPPYEGSSRAAMILEGDANPLRLPPETCPHVLSSVLAKMLAMQPSRRYSNMGEVLTALDAAIAAMKPAKPGDSARDAAPLLARTQHGVRWSFTAALVGGLLAACAILAAIIAYPSRPPTVVEASADALPVATAPILPAPTSAVVPPPAVVPQATAEAAPQGTPIFFTPPTVPEGPGGWPRGSGENVLKGVAPFPRAVPGVSQWQLVLTSPDGSVNATTWHPDGRRLAVSSDASLRIYNSDDLSLEGYVVPHPDDQIAALAWTRDGRRLGVLGWSGEVYVYNQELHLESSLNCGVSVSSYDGLNLVWSGDGNTIAVPFYDVGAVVLLKLDDRSVKRLDVGERLMGAAWNAAGDQLATGSREGVVRFWSQLGEALGEFRCGEAPLDVLGWNGDLLVAAFPDAKPPARLLTNDGRVVAELDHSRADRMRWLPNDEGFATVSVDGVVKRWALDGTAGPVVQASGHGGLGAKSTYHASFSPNGDRLAGSEVTRIGVWDAQGKLLQQRIGPHAMHLEWSPQGGWLAVGSVDQFVAFWGRDGRPAGHYRTALSTNLAWSPDDRWVASGVAGKPGAATWSPNGEPGSVWGWAAPIAPGLCWTPDGKLTLNSAGGELADWNAPTIRGRLLGDAAKLKSSLVRSSAWRPDGSRLALVADSGQFEIWDAEGKVIHSAPASATEKPLRVVWSHNGAMLGVMQERLISLLSPDGQLIRRLTPSDSGCNSFAWSHDDRRIIVGASYHSAMVFSVEDGTEAGKWLRLQRYVRGAATDPLGPSAATLDPSGVLYVHDLATGEVRWVGVSTVEGPVGVSPAGEVLHGDAALVDRELACVVARPTGGWRVMRPSEFKQFVAAAAAGEKK